MKKRTEILIEIERVRVVYRKNKRFFLFCERCGNETEFVSEIEAVALIDTRSAGNFHTKLSPGKTLIFCLNSIIEKIL